MVWVYRAIILSIQLAIRKIYSGRRVDESFSLWFQLTWGIPNSPHDHLVGLCQIWDLHVSRRKIPGSFGEQQVFPA